MPIEIYQVKTSAEEVKYVHYKSYMMLCINPNCKTPISIWKVFEGDKVAQTDTYERLNNYRVIFANGYFYGVGRDVIGLN